MNLPPPPTDPDTPPRGETACGARVLISLQSPSVYYQGELVYFCGDDCQQLYTEDPLNSCLASRLLSGK